MNKYSRVRKPKRDPFRELADNFFRESPLFRFISRGGAGRKRLRLYRKLKGTRRPKFCKQDIW